MHVLLKFTHPLNIYQYLLVFSFSMVKSNALTQLVHLNMIRYIAIEKSIVCIDLYIDLGSFNQCFLLNGHRPEQFIAHQPMKY